MATHRSNASLECCMLMCQGYFAGTGRTSCLFFVIMNFYFCLQVHNINSIDVSRGTQGYFTYTIVDCILVRGSGVVLTTHDHPMVDVEEVTTTCSCIRVGRWILVHYVPSPEERVGAVGSEAQSHCSDQESFTTTVAVSSNPAHIDFLPVVVGTVFQTSADGRGFSRALPFPSSSYFTGSLTRTIILVRGNQSLYSPLDAKHQARMLLSQP